MLIVSYAVNYMHLFVAVIAWLTIVFRGYLPEGVNNAMTFCNSFYARRLRLPARCSPTTTRRSASRQRAAPATRSTGGARHPSGAPGPAGHADRLRRQR